MPKVTWLGSDDPELKETAWAGVVFPKGKPVEVAKDWGPLGKAASNKFFKVEGYEAETKHSEPVTHIPPSEQPMPGPVPKGGEPIVREGLQMGSERPPPPEALLDKAIHRQEEIAAGQPAQGRATRRS